MLNQNSHTLSSRITLKKFYFVGLVILVSCVLHEFIAEADQESKVRIENSATEKNLNSQSQASPILLAKNPEKSGDKKKERKSRGLKGKRKNLSELDVAENSVHDMGKRIADLEVLEPALKAEVTTVTKMAATARTTKERRIATKKIRDAENAYIAAIRELRDLRKKIEVAKLELQSLGGKSSMVAKMESQPIKSKSISTKPKLKPKKTAKIKKASRPQVIASQKDSSVPVIASRKALKQSKASVAVTAKEGKKSFPWFGGRKEKKMEKGEENQELDDFDVLEMELAARAKGGVATLSSRSLQPKMKSPKSVSFLKKAYERALKDEADACLQVIKAYTSKKIQKNEEVAANKKYQKARDQVLKVLEELERAERSASSSLRG